MKAIKFTLKAWLTSVVSGLIVLLAIYLLSGNHGSFDNRVFQAMFFISLTCSLPILFFVTISVWLLLRTHITTRSKKLIIAIITTILIIAAIPIYLTSGNGSIINIFLNPEIYIYALPNWLGAMLAIMFYKLGPPEPVKP